MKQFNWPKNMAPNEALWLTIMPLMEEDAHICNVRLSKKHGMTLPKKTKQKAEPEEPKLDAMAQKIKMLIDEGLDVKVISKVVDLSRYKVSEYISKHNMK
jgi:hypothetical protein|tara:strand:- start:2199 stop:2498 length:300 start_codon:yes stop_codon:yes gene_type:complete